MSFAQSVSESAMIEILIFFQPRMSFNQSIYSTLRV